MNEFIVTIDGNKESVIVHNENEIEINGKIHDVKYSKINDHLYLIKIDNKSYEITTEFTGSNKYRFLIDGHLIESIVRSGLEEKANEYLKKKVSQSHHDIVKAPMPGMILKHFKKEGEQVKMGDPLVVLEAMKMENEIRSPASGVISEINFNEGESVEKDAVILKIE